MQWSAHCRQYTASLSYVGCAVLGTYSSVWFEELSLLVQSFTGASMSVFAIRESHVYTTSTVVHMCTVRVTVGCKTPATMVYTYNTYICIHILYVHTRYICVYVGCRMLVVGARPYTTQWRLRISFLSTSSWRVAAMLTLPHFQVHSPSLPFPCLPTT